MNAGFRAWRLVSALVVAVWLATAATDLVRAYVISGRTWPAGDVLFYINPANNDVSPDAAIAAIDQMATAWAAQSGASIRLVLAGTTTGSTIGNNGRNEIFFRNEVSGSTIASTSYYYSGSRILDADMKFYDGGFRFFTGTSGCTGGMYLEDVAIHEFGHFIGISHSTVTTATMYPTISGCSQNSRVLDPDDISAVRAAYPLAQPPAAPYSATAAPTGSNPSGSLTVSWADGATNETGFRVERSSAGSAFSVVATLGANTTSWINSGLTASTTYSYRVQAYNTTGSSGYSNTASATTNATPTTPPAAPTGPSPADGATSVQASAIGWSAVTGATSYDVYFGASTSPALYSGGVTTTSVGVSGLTAGATYYWRVVAKNAYGSTSGPTWRFTVKAKGKPR